MYKRQVKDSLVSHGDQIYGKVINSVLSPGVKIGEGSVVRDSVILNDVVIGKNCIIDKSIIDKNSVVGDNCVIGTGDDYTPNKERPDILNSGINVIGKRITIPQGMVIERNVRIFSSSKGKTIVENHIKSGETLA